MSFENTILPTIKRLSQLVNKQYGCELEYQSVTDLTRENLITLRQSLRRGEPVSAGDWVFFPVFTGTQLAGAARITNRDHIDGTQIRYLHQMISMVLESSLGSANRIEVLDELERRLRDMNNDKRTNIVRLSEFQENPFPLEKKPSSSPLNFPFLIEAKSSDDIFKMALEIHARTSRYAFLPLSDVHNDVLGSPEALSGLGHVTLFVSEISDLSMARQLELAAFYQSARTKEAPQIIAGTTKTISELKKSPAINPELLQLLTVGYLCMTQPFAVYKSENLLEFFYDSLTGRTSV